MHAAALDIETIADPSAVEHHRATLEAAAAKREQDVDTFCALSPPLARVVSVGLATTETNGPRRLAVVYDATLLPELAAEEAAKIAGCVTPARGEAELLEAAFGLLAHIDRLVTFAGRAFDLPVLVHRAKRHGVQVADVIRKGLEEKPWQRTAHVDLREVFSYGGATGRFPLAVYSIGYGLGDPKQDGDGGDVAALVRDGRTADLVRYQAGDARATAALWDRWCGLPMVA